MRPRAAVVVALAVLTVVTVAGTASATGNAPPLADAGLDQRVAPNATVYLDANESRDPDGEIASVVWTVESPDGDTRSPDCGSCHQTEFDVDETGQYNVTLSVTDDDNATRSDTLYVTVAASEGPSVTLSGPAVTSRNSGTEFTATVESDDPDLQSLAWVVDGDVVDQRSLDGTNATVSSTHSFDETGDASIRAVAYDTLGHRGADERTVTVGTPTRGGGGGPSCGPDAKGMWVDSNYICHDGEDRLITADGETYIQDVNDEDGIQLYDEQGNLVDLGKHQNNDNIGSDGKVVGGYGGGDLTKHLADGNDRITLSQNEDQQDTENSEGPGYDNYEITDGQQCNSCDDDDDTGRYQEQRGNSNAGSNLVSDSDDSSSSGSAGNDDSGGSGAVDSVTDTVSDTASSVGNAISNALGGSGDSSDGDDSGDSGNSGDDFSWPL